MANDTVMGYTPSGKPRLHQCHVCLRSFARLEHLKRHERSHTKEKPFDCGVCGRKFSRRDLLLRHAEKLHGGCADAVKRLRRRRRSANPEESAMPPMRAFNSGFNPATAGSRVSKSRDFDARDSKRARRASFSASSGANYAVAADAAADTSAGVEFSTPQLGPASAVEFSAVPAASLDRKSQSANDDVYGDYNIYGVESLDAEDWVNKVLESSQIEFLSSLKDQDSLKKVNESSGSDNKQHVPQPPNDEGIYGYSFYTDEFSETPSKLQMEPSKPSNGQFGEFAPKNSLFPEKISGSNVTEEVHNEYDLISELNNLQNFQFYLNNGGQMDRGDSSKSTNSTQTMISSTNSGAVEPVNSLFEGSKVFPHFNNISNGYSYYGVTPAPESHSVKPEVPSGSGLFTNALRSQIESTLAKYPFIGLPSPEIASNSELNVFVESFSTKFSKHIPIVHKYFLTEANMMKLTSLYWESPHTITVESACVCLPLLTATLGAIVMNRKRDASNLYEVSRRCIHVYLDSRKKNKAMLSSPLWLIQSLILSVIYGLFAEFDSGSEVIIKQVNALIALIRSSSLTSIRFEGGSKEHYLVYQSKLRTVYTIYKLSSLLQCYYGLKIAKALEADELELELPISEKSFECGKIDKTGSFKTVFNDILAGNRVDVLSVSELGLECLQIAMINKVGSITPKELVNYQRFCNSRLPNRIDKTFEWISNESLVLLFDCVFLNHYFEFRLRSSGHLDEVKYQGIWTKNWKKMTKKILSGELQISLDTIKSGICMLVDVFFNYNVRGTVNDEEFIKINELNLSYVKNGYDMIDKAVLSTILSLNLQLLFDVIIVFCQFSFEFEKYCEQVDSGINISHDSDSEFQDLFDGNQQDQHKYRLMRLLQDKSFIMRLKYYQVILKLFDKLEHFCEINYGFARISSGSHRTKNSVKVLRVGEFLFGGVFDREIGFNIFSTLAKGLASLRRGIE